jgi:hypothetical protein
VTQLPDIFGFSQARAILDGQSGPERSFFRESQAMSNQTLRPRQGPETVSDPGDRFDVLVSVYA